MDPNSNEATATPKQQLIERIKQSANLLVTVRSNPSVDELAACIGLTLMLNKLGKHATAVFSGEVPSTLEFLKPDETLETNTDSLRDFIVSLDKSKADKLRYKVEENVVKIFITPYRTSISEKDLEFTQGDFNVDVVLALGVTAREELDQAITSHGRILHDATVATIIAGQKESGIGNLNWQEPGASSLSEMLVSISEAFQGGLIDSQMATAFLTGIVAETERFSNTKTSPKVMTMAAQLMAAGANQQLIANELQKSGDLSPTQPDFADGVNVQNGDNSQANDDGALSINHESQEKPEDEQIQIDEEGNLLRDGRPINPRHKSVEPLGSPPSPQPDSTIPEMELPEVSGDAPNLASNLNDSSTLLDYEKAVHSPHLEIKPEVVSELAESVDTARDAVSSAINQIAFDPNRPEPRANIGSLPLGNESSTYDSFRLPTTETPNQMPPAMPTPGPNDAFTPPAQPLPPADEDAPAAPPLPPPFYPKQ